MAHYLVQAKPDSSRMKDLRESLDHGDIRELRPFGNTLHHSLENARIKADGFATWEEEDYCSPPLKQERAAVLDRYFTQLEVKAVQEGRGWCEIGALPRLWDKYAF